ncbi:hypothetical protein V6N13_053277 [Hibiscus sabdariffa]
MISPLQERSSLILGDTKRLRDEVKTSSDPPSSSAAPELDNGVQQSSTDSQTVISVNDKEAEIEDLEKKAIAFIFFSRRQLHLYPLRNCIYIEKFQHLL